MALIPWPFLRNHPNVRSFDSLADAVRAIMAAMRGEEATFARSPTSAAWACTDDHQHRHVVPCVA
jgi:hypothetical protein